MQDNFLKAVTVRYYYIGVDESDYFVKLHSAAELILSNGGKIETFEASGFKYLWRLESKVELNSVPCYFFSLIKEIKGWPLIFTDSEITEIAPPKGLLGNITFGLVCPAYKFLLCFTEAGGSSSFKRLLAEFSLGGLIRLDPILDETAEERVYSWDIYKRVALKVNLPTVDDVSVFEAGKVGERVNLTSYLGGARLDVSVDAGSGKERLSSPLVQDILPELAANVNCSALVVRGLDFDGGESETVDLKNPQLKYKDKLEMRGNYILASDALQVLKKAAAEKSKELFRER
jgi:hypothetical protein